MMNFLLASDGEQTQKNSSNNTRPNSNLTFSSYQSLGSHLRANQDMLQRRPTYLNPNNSIQDAGNRHQEDDTQRVGPFIPSSSNYISSIAPSLRGGMVPSSLSMGSPKIYSGSSVPKLPLFNDIGQPTCTTGFPKFSSSNLWSATKYHDHNNLPYVSSLTNMNTSSLFKDFDPIPHPTPSVNLNKFSSVKDNAMTSSLSSTTPFIQSMEPFNSDRLTYERTLKRPLSEVKGIDEIKENASKRARMSTTQPICYGGRQPHMEELQLFKDNPNSAPHIAMDANQEDVGDSDLDVSLHL